MESPATSNKASSKPRATKSRSISKDSSAEADAISTLQASLSRSTPPKQNEISSKDVKDEQDNTVTVSKSTSLKTQKTIIKISDLDESDRHVVSEGASESAEIPRRSSNVSKNKASSRLKSGRASTSEPLTAPSSPPLNSSSEALADTESMGSDTQDAKRTKRRREDKTGRSSRRDGKDKKRETFSGFESPHSDSVSEVRSTEGSVSSTLSPRRLDGHSRSSSQPKGSLESTLNSLAKRVLALENLVESFPKEEVVELHSTLKLYTSTLWQLADFQERLNEGVSSFEKIATFVEKDLAALKPPVKPSEDDSPEMQRQASDAQMRFYSTERVTFANALATSIDKFSPIVQSLHDVHTNVSRLHREAVTSTVPSSNERKLWETSVPLSSMRAIPWKQFLFTFFKDFSMSKESETALAAVLDPYGTKSILPSTFTRALKIFGTTEDLLSQCLRLTSLAVYQGYLDLAVVKKLLAASPVGTYVFRFTSGRVDRPSIALVKAPGEVITVPIERRDNGQFEFKDSLDLDKKLRKTSHEDLASLFAKLMGKGALSPFYDDLRSRPFFHPIRSRAEAHKLLAPCVPGTFAMYYCPDQSLGFLECSFVQSKATPKGDVPDLQTFVLAKQDGRFVTVGDSAHQYYSLDDVVSRNLNLKYNYSRDNVPMFTLKPFVLGLRKEDIAGPEKADEGVRIVDETLNLCAETISTYPKISLGNKIICDAFRVRSLGNRSVLVLCDGCGWYQKSRDAALAASAAFVDFLSDPALQNDTQDTETLKTHLRTAIDVCHEAIMKGLERPEDAGQCTLIGGVLVQVKTWAFISIGVGDSKIYRLDHATGQVFDVTFGSRGNATNAADPGGRIGPYVGKNDPDLRNLSYYFTPCSPDDVIFLVSDGVYDNVDPEHLGLTPRQVFESDSIGVQYDDWEAVPVDVALEKKELFKIDKIHALCAEAMKIEGARGSPEAIVTSLLKNASETTKKTREFMEAHPTESEPRDYLTYPGKMDHTTCVALRVSSKAIGNPISKKMTKKPSRFLSSNTSQRVLLSRPSMDDTNFSPQASALAKKASRQDLEMRFQRRRSADDLRKSQSARGEDLVSRTSQDSTPAPVVSKAALSKALALVRKDFATIVHEKPAFDTFASYLEKEHLTGVLKLYKELKTQPYDDWETPRRKSFSGSLEKAVASLHKSMNSFVNRITLILEDDDNPENLIALEDCLELHLQEYFDEFDAKFISGELVLPTAAASAPNINITHVSKSAVKQPEPKPADAELKPPRSDSTTTKSAKVSPRTPSDKVGDKKSPSVVAVQATSASELIPSSSQATLNTVSFFKMLVPGTESYSLFEKFLQARNKANDLLCYTALVKLERLLRKDPKTDIDEETRLKIKEWLGATKSSNHLSLPDSVLAPVRAKMAETSRISIDWFGPVKEALVKHLDALHREYSMGKAF